MQSKSLKPPRKPARAAAATSARKKVGAAAAAGIPSKAGKAARARGATLKLKSGGNGATPTATRGAAKATTAAEVLAWLERTGTRAVRDGMARYAIPSAGAYGVSVAKMKAYGQDIGRNHELALELWKTGRYEARFLCSWIADPEQLTARQMDLWARDFDNWAIVDTLCFHLFDRSPLAAARAAKWARAQPEFERRAGFALMWALALHDKQASDETFLAYIPALELGAHDERNFVKKAVDMALRAIARRNVRLHARMRALAERLACSGDATAGWVGRAALRGMRAPAARKKS